MKKLISTVLMTLVFALTLGVAVFAASNDFKVTANPASGSTVAFGDKIEVVASLENKNKGIYAMNVALYDADTNAKIKANDVLITDPIRGNNSVTGQVVIPNGITAKNLKLIATLEDEEKRTFDYTFTYVGPATASSTITPGGDVVIGGNKMTITANPVSKSTIKPGSDVKFITTGSNKMVGVVTTRVTVYDNDGKVVMDKTFASKQAEGANPLNVIKAMPDVAGTYKVVVTSKDCNGGQATATFIYYIEDEEKEPENKYINPDLDGLAIDLWLVEDTRFYELDKDEIPFVAYYYNAEKKTMKDVTIEVEIPDGFELVKNSIKTEVGTGKLKGDTILYTIGDVPGKTLGEVYFTLIATDDDVCEEITNIQAVIFSDDDEEDTSTQRVLIFEEGEEGSFSSYVTGYPDGSFQPDDDITREEVAAIMARAFKHTATNTTKTFSDVKKNGWAYNYIMACTAKNIIKGYTDGTFRPYNSITRAELYAMTYRAMDISEDEKAVFVPKKYKKETSWETTYVAGLERLLMLKDMDDTEPDENASRADVVYLVNGVQFRNPSNKLKASYNDLSSRHWCAKNIIAASCTYEFEREADGTEKIK
ncbi:MAG: S-layer homology domain-containing protein [Clostridia bacterium]|nr:S-layer homology domain-containing protein [Clostridia bacterium]